MAVYLDHHATTPCDQRVIEAMLPWFGEHFGNPASRDHAFGREALEAVERARGQVAEAIGARPDEIVFTSGTTESTNLALKGLAARARRSATRGDDDRPARHRLVVSAIEHEAVLEPCRTLEQQGVEVAHAPVDERGVVSVEALRRAVDERTLAVAVMAANNEIGTLQPIGEVAAVAREAGALLLCDAAQAVGKVPFDVRSPAVDLATFSAHKLYGPKGIGALYVRSGRPRIRLAPLLEGGGHERGLRSGTLNVPAIVGFGEACALAWREREADEAHTRGLRDRLLTRLREEVDGVHVNGSLDARLPNNLHVSFEGVASDALLETLDDVAVSSESACGGGGGGPSHVLRALGLGDARAYSAVRFGVGRFTTAAEIDHAASRIGELVRRLRAR